MPKWLQEKMKLRIVLSVLLISNVILATPSLAIENGKDASGNSHVVKVIATFNKTKVRTCSGGVLSEYVVVTAAHCLDDESGLLSKEIWVLPPGVSSKRDSSGAYLQDSTWILVDNTQITLTFQNSTEKVEDDDLAFLVLSKPVKLETKTNIPSEDETTKLRSSAASLRLYGYGYTSDAGAMTDSPNYYIARFDNQMTVAVKNSGYATATDATSCQGDSGGPVLSVTPTSVTVVGVITGGPTSVRCGKKQSDGKFYTLFTYLSRYANLAFAAASSASKKAVEAAQAAELSAKASLESAKSDAAEARQEAEDAASELASVEEDLETANLRIEELGTQVQDLLNQIRILTAKLTITINCIKGTQIKKVTGIEPKCPSGYKRK
jgi:secreted trypsin-like serine protease